MAHELVLDDDEAESNNSYGNDTGKESNEDWVEVPGRSNGQDKDSPSSSRVSGLQLSYSDVKDELEYWSTAVYCYVLGANPPWKVIDGFVKRIWGYTEIEKIAFHSNGIFLVRFKTEAIKLRVLQAGPVFFDNKPIVVKEWTSETKLIWEAVDLVPIWIRFYGLPLKLWGNALKKIANLVGSPIRCDSNTQLKTFLGYARVMVEVKVGDDLPDVIEFMDELDNKHRQIVHYEWKPTICTECKAMGHLSRDCRMKDKQKKWASAWTGEGFSDGLGALVTPIPFSFHPSFSPSRIITQLIRQGWISLNSSRRTFLEVLERSIHVREVINTKVTFLSTGVHWWVSVVYGFNRIAERIPLWESLTHMHGIVDGPWMGLEPTFGDTVKSVWDQQIDGFTMFQLVKKLKMLKQSFNALNGSSFANIETTANVALIHLHDTQKQLHLDLSNILSQQNEKLAADTFRELDKARDRHGVTQNTNAGIEEAFEDYYKNLLGSSKLVGDVHFPTLRKGKTVYGLHAAELVKEVSDSEINEALFSIPPNKSPGLDGYTSQFYKDAYSIVGKDIIKVNSTTLTLIPKKDRPISVADFRPIACCNVLYMIISKVLCNRMAIVLPEIISANQSAFIKDDLLMFLGVTGVLKLLLRAFATCFSVSGLEMNYDKSDIYFNGMCQGEVDYVLRISGFKEGHFPFKYLSIPISYKRMAIGDCTRLVEKVVSKLRGWGAKKLSYTRRLVLTQAVLTQLHVYWSRIFVIPITVIDRVTTICRNYLWSGS
ncbi:uncharacterized protein LOC141588059 [Silene latifolia]|uniref:uncharacterized protein LOC141588059 n=1 Tax=Silene latifolia TaxID=37657 RepID=UPI003D76F327